MAHVDTEVLGTVAVLAAHDDRSTMPEVSLIDLLTILLEKKRLILGASLTAGIVTAAIVSFLPSIL